jgi:predicted ATPase
MQFKKITLSNWRQFSNVEIDFHEKLTIITGANGAGKTTILRLLSQHFGWNSVLLATPKRRASTPGFLYNTGVSKHNNIASPQNIVGSITYNNDITSNIAIPESGGVQYHAQIINQQGVVGMHINSHRHQQNYQQVSSIPTNAIGAEQAYGVYFSELMQRFQGGHSQFSPTYRMKETIISMATFGPGNANVQGNPDIERLFIEFKTILGKLLPPTIGFMDISVRIPDVVLTTRSGEFILDAASGGLSSIIDLAWQIFLFAHNKEDFCVTIDEPENHLHPSMQRSILTRLTDAFPKAQFIVVTHSPFIVSSVRDSAVYALQYIKSGESNSDEFTDRKVQSIRLDLDSKAATATEILRDVLGVPVTLPEWAELDLSKIASEISELGINEGSLNLLRDKLNAAGLGEYFPQALHEVIGGAQ